MQTTIKYCFVHSSYHFSYYFPNGVNHIHIDDVVYAIIAGSQVADGLLKLSLKSLQLLSVAKQWKTQLKILTILIMIQCVNGPAAQDFVYSALKLSFRVISILLRPLLVLAQSSQVSYQTCRDLCTHILLETILDSIVKMIVHWLLDWKMSLLTQKYPCNVAWCKMAQQLILYFLVFTF